MELGNDGKAVFWLGAGVGNMTKAIILDFLQQNKQKFADDFGVTKLGLFGSYARDEACEDSDIDIVIELVKKDFFVRDDIRKHLEGVLGKLVDIGYLDSFRGFYRDKIQKEIIYV